MSEKRDYYEVLGVSREASADDIRRSYRQCALKYHPDRNPNDPSAEEKFKEATEAYSILSDDEKRGNYDRFGHAGVGGGFDFGAAGMGDIFSHFQDLFSDFFGGMGGFGFGGGGGGRRQAPVRGQDVRVEASISLKDAMTGCKHEVVVRGAAACEECNGSGAKKGTKPERCAQCGGKGQVTPFFGIVHHFQRHPILDGMAGVERFYLHQYQCRDFLYHLIQFHQGGVANGFQDIVAVFHIGCSYILL